MQKVRTKLSSLLDIGSSSYERTRAIVLLLCLFLLAAVGIYIFLWGTGPHGIGITTDSVDYIWSAKNLARGIGLGTLDAYGHFVPLTVEPPLYPMLLSIFELVGIGVLEGARWLGALSIGLIFVASGLILARLTRRSFWFPLIGTFVLLFLPATWATIIYAMSEPVYLVLTLAGLLSLDYYLSNDRRRWLILAAILSGMAFLDRYVGISIIAAGVLLVLLQRRLERKRKIQNVLLMGGIAILPMLVWIIRNLLLARTATNYAVGFVPISTREWVLLWETVRAWILPVIDFKFTPVKLIILLVPLPIAYLFFRRGKITVPSQTCLPSLLAIYTLFYALFVFISRWVAYPLVTFYQDRILYPVLISAFCLILYGLYLLQLAAHRRSSLLASLFAAILILGAWSFSLGGSRPYPPGINQVLTNRKTGLGLQYQAYPAADFKDQLARLPGSEIIFTDDTQRLYFYSGRSSSYAGDLSRNNLETLREQLRQNEIALVLFFDSPEVRQTLQQQIPQLRLIYSDTNQNAIYLGSQIP